ncbi:MAG: hypothetical protein Q8N91_04660, partial [Candidatus Omnitrophota bacterium]|nr:hypothetical protein [Candidatus Omnitrophota bacterium]
RLWSRSERRTRSFEDDRISDFEIRGSGTKIKKGIFGGRVMSGWYDITCFSVGKHEIPQAEIKYRTKGAREWVAKKVRAIDIAVDSVLAAGGGVNDIKDIKGPMNFFDVTMLIIFSTLILSAAGIGVYIIYKITRKALKQKFPYDIAMEELETISNAFSGGGDVKGYYVGVSDCVRRYIENVFRLKAPEMTTEEFLGSLKDSAALSSVHKNLLERFLGACDLVKFAKYAPTRIEAESIFTTARIFIEETKGVFAHGMEGAKP